MKKNNMLRVLISIALIVLTMTTSVITAYAYPTFRSGPYNVDKILIATNQGAIGATAYDGATAEYLLAIVVSTKEDQYGNRLTPDTKDSYAYNTKHSGGARISCTNTSNKYIKVTCTHGAKYRGYAETSSNSSKSF